MSPIGEGPIVGAMTPSQPPASGPGDPTSTAASDDVTSADQQPPDLAAPAPAPEQPGPASGAASSIPDRDPFVDTDTFPTLDGPSPRSTGGFAGLSSPGAVLRTPTGTQLHPGPVSAPPPMPPGAPTAGSTPADPAPHPDAFSSPGPGTEPAGGPGITGTGAVMAPSMIGPAFGPNPATGPGPSGPGPAGPGPSGPGPGAAGRGPRRPSNALLAAIAGVAAVVLVGAGMVGGMALAGDSDGEGTELAASPPTTARPPSTTGTSRPTPSTRPRSSTSATPTTATSGAGDAPTSTTPTSASTPSASNGELVADFAWTPDPAQAGGTITLVDRSSGGPTRWTWQWNGNTVSSNKSKGVTTSVNRDTIITLTVCKGAAEETCATVSKTVTVS